MLSGVAGRASAGSLFKAQAIRDDRRRTTRSADLTHHRGYRQRPRRSQGQQELLKKTC